ncbi:2-polyprenyl-6-methoxyphenol hydroxylase-like FAD-dependent oxidoreductase [Saccharopolyspora erythraea NRRL 2338]|uniref:FAD-dependent monooxygenase n=1 Tax=Saccharopolyspora erythraea TaxID=1836 RepID=A0ABP3N3U5_SACER|nr:FAD-dependent monooxygenase [Saccharopolyspora erythraea]EQD86500.1 PheA/TfdB family FAD-binding monooxygenase [Saccharopolyspora erythraea D]PFG99369.1 2-polyprenyl-6-methoxyphenol hydroxylase-like FAD-dependent oxidoreductase [Saccharopolyspora erythraea NRRL 2338]
MTTTNTNTGMTGGQSGRRSGDGPIGVENGAVEAENGPIGPKDGAIEVKSGAIGPKDGAGTPVLIAGAGLAGLSTAVFLGLHGVRAVVVERHASTSTHPKARGQRPHTMEALRLAGLEESFAAASPKSRGFTIRIAESVRGPVFREIVHDTFVQLGHLTPAGSADASQESAERILAARARELGADLRFSTELESFEQDGHGVTATVRDLTNGERSTLRAGYLVGADGNRSPVREALGIGTHGEGSFGHYIHWTIRADLAPLVGDQQVLYYLRNPELSGASGVVCSTDDPDRFIVAVAYDPAVEDEFDFPDERALEQVRIAVGVDDLDVEILARAAVETGMHVADRFSAGRAHLVGDAAHTMPPQGGMGGNTAVMDGFYLAWKLAAVVKGEAGPSLLDSHDAERRPVGEWIARNQYNNAIYRNARPGDAQRDAAGEAEPPIEDPGLLCFGYRHNGAIVAEPGDEGELLEDPTQPTGRPGSRAPHVVLRSGGGGWSGGGVEGPGGGGSGGGSGNGSGSRKGEGSGGRDGLSTIDLFGRDFVLLAGSEDWVRSAVAVGDSLGVGLTAHLIGRAGSGSGEFEGEWADAYGVSEQGAVLVRPDRFIAWRSVGAGTTAELEKALRTVLGR